MFRFFEAQKFAQMAGRYVLFVQFGDCHPYPLSNEFGDSLTKDQRIH
jgi:hypothetical protein